MFGVPGAGSPLSTSSWLSLAAPAHINQLLLPTLKLSARSEGVERWREWEALGWDGAHIPPTISPPPMANIHGRFRSSDTHLRDPPTPPEPLRALHHQPHLFLGGDKSPRQPSRELSQGSPLTSLPLCPRSEVAVSPHCLRGYSATSGGTRFHLAGLWCQNSAFPAPCHGEAALVRGCWSEGGLLRASTTNARQRHKRETHALTLEQLREREGQNHPPGSDLFARLR